MYFPPACSNHKIQIGALLCLGCNVVLSVVLCCVVSCVFSLGVILCVILCYVVLLFPLAHVFTFACFCLDSFWFGIVLFAFIDLIIRSIQKTTQKKTKDKNEDRARQ